MRICVLQRPPAPVHKPPPLPQPTLRLSPSSSTASRRNYHHSPVSLTRMRSRQSWSTSDLASLMWQGEGAGRVPSLHIALHKSDPFISKNCFCKIFKHTAIKPATQLSLRPTHTCDVHPRSKAHSPSVFWWLICAVHS